jgi:hypothetical protein
MQLPSKETAIPSQDSRAHDIKESQAQKMWLCKNKKGTDEQMMSSMLWH